MGIRSTVDYYLQQKIQLANGQTRFEQIGHGLGNDAIDRMVVLRDKYVSEGFDVELVKVTGKINTEILST